MAIHVAIQHFTQYLYNKPIHVSPQVIRLRPAPHSRTPILGYSLNITPKEHFINWQQDPFGNYLARVVFPDKIHSLSIEVEVIADMISINPFDFFLEEYAQHFPFKYDQQLLKELTPYLEIKESGSLLIQWVEKMKLQKQTEETTNDFLVRLNQQLCKDINYTIRLETGIQDCETTLSKALGSCRDSAWLLTQIFRHFGLAARFVSGYLVQLKADEKPLEGPSGTEVDFNDLHAWTEVYLPGAGWVGLDATSGLLAGEGHIPLAATPDPGSAAPISGFTEPCEVTFKYKNEVSRIYESARVTKPYSDDQWQAVLALGETVEETLQRGDVRLTMGGEPTFVGTEDRDSPEWNDDADGENKRKQALQLAQKLKNHFAANGFIHFGQGKWYPGEPLPRWQYAIFWRKDGKALWIDESLAADPTKDYGMTEKHSETFIKTLSTQLGINEKNCLPCYEDIYYFLWEKNNLPVQVNPEDIDKEDSLSRQKLLEVLQRGLDKAVGYVLPIAHDYVDGGWKSCLWQFNRNELFLIPGNSSMGLRLPLNRLPKLLPEQEEAPYEVSPLDELPPLPDHKDLSTSTIDKGIVPLRTALCVEPREGKLYVFMPPLQSLESYVELCYHIEQTATILSLPVIIEGYHPPTDYRLEKLVVTPDPGVIEVNVQPAKSWQEIVHNYEHLFELAKECKLTSEKFMLDGKHTGTGGGNHITLGGTTPKDSPLLRKPSLLRSFVNFWQNHPGLSYLFSSAFVGPTSQAPRVDEGRKEILYELEIAFDQIDKYEDPPAWIVDRVFRNLLIDLTGNTHRAEFCIDKLYSPDSQSGRLGILEMRGFDMPPHKQMCLVQLLLIRTLTACFWKNPYKQKLVRWGTELHDKFLIHHYVREDLMDVVEYLQSNGFDFKMEWLESFFEFRFPILGTLTVKDMTLTLRTGIEPWNVLGEEMSSSGTARYVDSSVERVEVLVEGFNADRYKVLCNRHAVPMIATPTKGKYVAGIRYKAWNPPSALHPTVGVDVPLVFDIYDTWNKRSIGGCTYHVAHPGGRSYDTFPVNSYEAEGRRISRFWDYNHSITDIVSQEKKQDGPYRYTTITEQPAENIEVNEVPPNLDYPHTFDLRRV
ncbi:MAG: transglutaminase family protein [Chitinophagales bacterium]